RHLNYPFTPVENVLVQTVAGAVGTMPLSAGLVGVMPALNYLLKQSENGPLVLGLGRLIAWSVGLCFFGVFFAVPLRREVIIREKLKFPSGTATALMIKVLHGDTDDMDKVPPDESQRRQEFDESSSLTGTAHGEAGGDEQPLSHTAMEEADELGSGVGRKNSWQSKVKLLVISLAISGVYVRSTSPARESTWF